MTDQHSGRRSALEEISSLAAFMKSSNPNNVLIPLRQGSKSPAMPHKGGQYTWSHWDACMNSGTHYTEFGLLLRTMVVVDADSSEAVTLLESKYPALHQCPCVRTRKGKHYYFLRSSLCEEKNVTDSTGVWDKIDLKTVTNSLHEHVVDGTMIATAAVVVVPPSTNKEWIRSILDTPLEPIPDQLIQDMLATKQSVPRRPNAPTHTVAQGSLDRYSDTHEQGAMVAGIKALLLEVCKDSTSAFDKMDENDQHTWSLYFRNGPGGRTCPDGHQHVRNNFYVRCHEGGACYYFCLSSECRRQTYLGQISRSGTEESSPPESPGLPTMDQTLHLMRVSLKPCRFENLHELAGAVKSCFGKSSFGVFQRLLENHPSCPSSTRQLEEAFRSARSDDDANRVMRWVREDSLENWEVLKSHHVGPPSMEDKIAAQALLTYMRRRLGFEFLYCLPGVQYFWDGERFHDNSDDAHTFRVAMEHGKEIAGIYNVCPKMYSQHRKIKDICGLLRGLTVDRDAHGKMDRNTKMLGFDDGVLELDTGIFRPRRYSDYVTKSVGYNFPKERDALAEAEVMEFFKQVHRDERIRNFVLYRLSSCLEGYNIDEKGPMWTGASGANGKSKMAELMKAVMGQYGGMLESSQLTTARTSGTANSQLASSMLLRFLVIEEPDTVSKSWNWEVFKEITGRSELQVRGLYERPITMRPHFTPVIIFNSLPEESTKIDKAVQRRAEVIPFESEFTEVPRLPHQFPIDLRLSDKFPSWRGHLFNILYHDYYQKYVLTSKPLKVPECCTLTMHSIMDTGQDVRRWFEERVVQDPRGLLTLRGAGDDFNNLWRPRLEDPCEEITSKLLKKQLCGLLNRHPQEQMCNSMTNNRKVTNVWKGWRLRAP